MARIFLSIFWATMLSFSSAALAKDPHPLFAEDTPIKITITAPFDELVRKAERSTDPYDASLTLEGEAAETHAIILSARGKSRRRSELCNFPPLRVEFAQKPEDTSFFDGQKRLKLVTHCKRLTRFQQYYLLEYSAYRLLNVLTPVSLKVRLAEIDYVDSKNGKTVVSRMGFFIEDTDDAAKRNDLYEIDTPDIDVDQLNIDAAAQYAVFQYMIGNLDWSMHNGPDESDCCHNTKLVGSEKKATTDLKPVAYDFDYSGLVGAPYSAPPESVKVKSTRTRRYRGFCAQNDAALAAIEKFRAHQTELLSVYDDIPGMSGGTKRSAIRYIEAFFKDIETDKKVDRNLFRYCRN